MTPKISPKYLMKLTADIESALSKEYFTSERIEYYLERWIESDDWNNQNLYIKKHELTGDINVKSTLHTIDGETLLKIAIDLGVETPDFLPAIPTFRNEIKSDYSTASATFEKAFRQIEEHPDIAVGLANSALESIIKEILKDQRILTQLNPSKTLYDLTIDLLKEFQLFPDSDMPIEIKTIGSSLLAAAQGIEKLRSEKTTVHGKTLEDYVINDSLYTYFIVNSVTTVGLFLNSFYKNKFPKKKLEILDNSLPF